MSRLNPPPFVGGPLLPCILKWAELEIAASDGRPVSNLAMSVGNGGGEIAITDTSDPALTSCASGNVASVLDIADAVGFKNRDVPGVPQHLTEGVLGENGPASKKPKLVYTSIARYVTGEKACYDPEDIQYRIFKHARE
jgi:hypothetical protein